MSDGFKSTDVFLALARRGCGKTYLADRISGAYPRKVVFDPMGEYCDDSDPRVVFGFEEFSRKILESENAPEFEIVYKFDVESEDHAAEFNQALRVLWYRGNVLIRVEEIQLFASPHRLPMWLHRQLFTGRHRNNALFFTTQRPGECHKAIISQANHIFFGSLHEKNDVEYARTVLRERSDELVSLPERKFLYFRPAQPLLFVNNDLTGST